MKRETVFADFWLYLMDNVIPARARMTRAEFELRQTQRMVFRCEQKARRLRFQSRMLELTVEQLRVEATTTKQNVKTQ